MVQAKDYAEKLSVRMAYASNGQGIYAMDMQSGAEREINAHPTPDALWNTTFAAANDGRDRFAAIPFEDKGGSYPSSFYQDSAVERVLETVSTDKKRIFAHAGDGHGKNIYRVSDCVEIVSRPMEFERHG